MAPSPVAHGTTHLHDPRGSPTSNKLLHFNIPENHGADEVKEFPDAVLCLRRVLPLRPRVAVHPRAYPHLREGELRRGAAQDAPLTFHAQGLLSAMSVPASEASRPPGSDLVFGALSRLGCVYDTIAKRRQFRRWVEGCGRRRSLPPVTPLVHAIRSANTATSTA